MFERPKSGERAVLVHVGQYEDAESLAELQQLAITAGADPVAVITGKRPSPDPRYYIGKGKLDEL